MRNSQLEVSEDSVLYCIANHRDLKGELLDKHIAAVELINILRPTVAIASFISCY